MPEYLVTWKIEVTANCPQEAAEQAREYQLNPDALVGAFKVIDLDTEERTEVDLDDSETPGCSCARPPSG